MQAFVRDPDGYYIEFCNCHKLDEVMEEKEMENEALIASLPTSLSSLKMSNAVREWAKTAKSRSDKNEVIVMDINTFNEFKLSF